MSIPKFTLFEHRLEGKYNTVFQKLPEMIKALRLSNSLDDGDLSKIKKDVFKDLTSTWNMDFEIKRSAISVQNQEFNFEKSIATDILNTTTSSTMPGDFVTLYYAIYTVPYTGKFESVKYTTSNSPENVFLTEHSNYFALTVYALNPIEQSANTIKAEKDRILNLIEKNQEANEAFIKSKESLLKDAIDKEIDLHFKSGHGEITDNSLL